MGKIVSYPISESVSLRAFTDPNFKTMKISVDMLIPISALTAAKYGILPSLVSRATLEYSDYTALSRRLSELYGAALDSSVRKMGAYQVLTLSAGGISSRYALEGEDMFGELCELLFSVLFHPLKTEDGEFVKEHFEQEKRQLLELKDAEFGDKMLYAHQCCEQLHFAKSEAGVNRYGSREDILNLELSGLSEAWEELLKKSHFEIFILGDCEPELSVFRERFQGLGSSFPMTYLKMDPPSEVQRKTEEQTLSQSKLSMAFAVDFRPEERLAFQLMSAVFGGTPSSKLFRNVREKQSLCYYCSSVFDAAGSTLYVESGVETENLVRAEEAILHELDALQQGEVTEEELDAAKLALCNAMRSVRDSLNAVENFCVSRLFDPVLEPPDELVRKIEALRKEDVVCAAKKVVLSAVFSLKGCANA